MSTTAAMIGGITYPTGGSICPRCFSLPCRCVSVWQQPMPYYHRVPYRCPVCEGCGTVPPDFYSRIGYATSTERETCKACSGYGLVWAS